MTKNNGFNRVFLLAGILSLILSAFFCPFVTAAEEKAPRGGTLKMVYGEPIHLNPALTSGTVVTVPSAQIFAGLLQFDDKFKPRPYLAKKWEVSPDGKAYTFYLEEGATFHDGKPITSADVAFSLETVKQNHPFGVAMFRAVETVDTSDPHKAVFKLKNPYPALLAATHPILLPILPKHVYGVGEIRKNPANVNPVGSGPFKFVEWKKGQSIILSRYENFFRKGHPYLDRIIVEFVPDASARTVAMESGAIDLLPFSQIDTMDARRLEKMPNLGLTERGYESLGAQWWLAINVRKPPLNNVKVRKAIAHAIDKDFVVKEIFNGFGKPAHGPFNYASPFYNPNLQRYEYNLAKANQLLDEAGYPRKADGTRFALNIDWIPWGPAEKSFCEYLKEQLRNLGIAGTLRISPDMATYASRIGAWDFDLNMDMVFNYPDPAIGIERTYISANIKNIAWTNTMGYSNPEVDRLFAGAQIEQNFEKRKQLYYKAQEILVDELPIIWFKDSGFYTLYNKGLINVPMDVWGVLNPWDGVSKGK